MAEIERQAAFWVVEVEDLRFCQSLKDRVGLEIQYLRCVKCLWHVILAGTHSFERFAISKSFETFVDVLDNHGMLHCYDLSGSDLQDGCRGNAVHFRE